MKLLLHGTAAALALFTATSSVKAIPILYHNPEKDTQIPLILPQTDSETIQDQAEIKGVAELLAQIRAQQDAEMGLDLAQVQTQAEFWGMMKKAAKKTYNKAKDVGKKTYKKSKSIGSRI